jgi:hypothetical protein
VVRLIGWIFSALLFPARSGQSPRRVLATWSWDRFRLGVARVIEPARLL